MDRDRTGEGTATSGRAWLVYLAVALANAGTIALARAISRTTTEGVPLWAAAGVTVAVLLLVPRSWWTGVLVATFATNLVGNLILDISPGTAAGGALANTIEPLVGATVVLTVLGRAPRLDDHGELFVFLGGAGICGPVVGAAIGTAAIAQVSGHPPLPDVFGRWFTGDALGVLVVGSLILAWAQPDPRAQARSRTDALLAGGLLLAVAIVGFWGTSPVLAYAVLPPLLWLAFRFGVRGATVGALLITVIADWATIRGHGLFVELSGVGEHEALWHLQAFLAVLLLAVLLVAAQMAELDEAQRALRARDEQQRIMSLIESSPDPIMIVTEAGTIEYVNEQLIETTQFGRDELIGQNVAELGPRYVRDTVRDTLMRAREIDAGGRFSVEISRFGPNQDRDYEVAVSPFDTAGGRGVVATFRDITDRLAAEGALREARDAAQSATEAKTQFLATMSHEIRTPMSAVSGLIELLAHTDLDDEQRSLVATMRTSSEALLRIIDDTLDLSKIEAGRLELEEVPLSIADVVRATASLMEPAAAMKGIGLRCTTAPDLPPVVLGDPLRLRQILLNLVSNAIKFTREGTVDLEAIVAAPDVDGLVGVTFTVHDTGIGMDQARQAQVFRPYTQAEQSTTRVYGGTGLGLSIVSHLVEMMGGQIDLTSAPGEGSTFVVRLRMPPASASATPQDRVSSAPGSDGIDHARLAGHVVLVAEDNAVNRTLLERQLALVGCATELVADGQEALDRLASGGVSLVLTDCHMPVLDGYELARAVRSAEERSGAGARLPMVAITANAMREEAERCTSAGLDACLVKPVSVAQLATVLERLLPREPVRAPATFDRSVLREIVGDDDQAITEILGTFADAVRADAAEVYAAVAGEQAVQAGRPAHKIVGAARSVGASRMASLARVIEIASASGQARDLGSAAAAVVAEAEVIRHEVARLGAVRG